MEEIKIKSFDDLIEFIENEDVPIKDINEIVRQTMNVIVLFETKDKAELIVKLKDYWSKWKNQREHPLFLGLDLDVEID